MQKYFYLSLFLYSGSALATCNLLSSGYSINSLFGFLHNILPKKTSRVEELFIFENAQEPSCFLLNYGFYGITDTLTFIPTVPIVSKKQKPCGPSNGLGNISFQFNYLLYQQEEFNCRYRIIATAGIGFPTTTIKATTLYSIKAMNSFIGIMHDIMTLDWYWYTDFGGVVIGNNESYKAGNYILYSLGGGRTLCKNDHYVTLMIEMLNVYQRPDRCNGHNNLKTGSAVLYCGPTLRYYYKHYSLHAGILGTIGVFSRIPEKHSNYLCGFAASVYF